MSRPDRSQSPHPKRVPIGTRNKLTAEPRQGFVRRWVNDVNERIQMFLEAGYEMVSKPTKVGDSPADASQLDSVVRKPVGGGINAVLMEIPEAWNEEDKARKEDALKQKEMSLLSEAKEGFYGEGIKMSSSQPRVTIE